MENENMFSLVWFSHDVNALIMIRLPNLVKLLNCSVRNNLEE